jgi:hypothetical protein
VCAQVRLGVWGLGEGGLGIILGEGYDRHFILSPA